MVPHFKYIRLSNTQNNNRVIKKKKKNNVLTSCNCYDKILSSICYSLNEIRLNLDIIDPTNRWRGFLNRLFMFHSVESIWSWQSVTKMDYSEYWVELFFLQSWKIAKKKRQLLKHTSFAVRVLYVRLFSLRRVGH